MKEQIPKVTYMLLFLSCRPLYSHYRAMLKDPSRSSKSSRISPVPNTSTTHHRIMCTFHIISSVVCIHIARRIWLQPSIEVCPRNVLGISQPDSYSEHYAILCLKTPSQLLFGISRNQGKQAELAGMKNSPNSRHIREGISNPRHTQRGGMSQNAVGMKILCIFLDMQFGGVLNYVWTHSRANRDVPISSGN